LPGCSGSLTRTKQLTLFRIFCRRPSSQSWPMSRRSVPQSKTCMAGCGNNSFLFVFNDLCLGKATFFTHGIDIGGCSFADRAVCSGTRSAVSGERIHAVHCSLRRSHCAFAIAPLRKRSHFLRRASEIEVRAKGRVAQCEYFVLASTGSEWFGARMRLPREPLLLRASIRAT
jgi:hypothetical protein